jgi:hypothetical protein
MRTAMAKLKPESNMKEKKTESLPYSCTNEDLVMYLLQHDFKVRKIACMEEPSGDVFKVTLTKKEER